MIYDLRYTNRSSKKQLGFSLIELIVVITIIMVISAVAVVSFTTASAKGRDGRRMADLEKVRQALEFYKEKVGSYPAAANFSALSGYLAPDYIQSLPSDPQSTSHGYYYSRGASTFTYTLGAWVEGTGNTTSFGWCGVGAGEEACNYGVNNP